MAAVRRGQSLRRGADVDFALVLRAFFSVPRRWRSPASRRAATSRSPGRRVRRRRSTESTALRVSRRRDGLRSGADHRSVFANHRRRHLRSAVRIRAPRPAGAPAAADGGGVARGQRRLQDLHRAPQAGHLLQRRSRLSRQAARADRCRLRLQLKRHFDPHWKSPSFSTYEEYGIVGLAELRAAALAGKPFDYDRDVPGLRALDRYTLQIRLARPPPRFIDR